MERKGLSTGKVAVVSIGINHLYQSPWVMLHEQTTPEPQELMSTKVYL